uniref:Variant surface glycoprotein 1125.2704 n=1 Tax=Trypanosoma brucei TaxID=5691 RepID=A0A1J0R8P9_9TRYP|nr:variant surface glycoprotein 1125.2704 [Trypanosoma brucei]
MQNAIVLDCLTMAAVHHAQAAAGDNAAEFSLLCSLYLTCDQGVALTDLDATEATRSAIQSLVAINLTAADNEFYGLDFSKPPPNPPEDANYSEFISTWSDLKRQLTEGTLAVEGTIIARLPNNDLRKHVQATALGLIKSLKKQIEDIPTAEKAASINAMLKEALYGPGASKAETTAGKTFGSSGPNSCGNTGDSGNNAGISIANDLTCLCGGGDTALVACTHTGDTLDNKGMTSDSVAATAFNQVKTKCRVQKKEGPTEAVLAASLASFRNAIGTRHTGNGNRKEHYGKGGGDACSATDAEGCINYKQQMSGNKLEIKWLKAIENALAEINKHRLQQQAIKNLKRHAAAFVETALRAYRHATVLNTVLANTQQPPQMAKEKSVKQHVKCEQFHKKSTECTANGCKWEGTTETDGKCIVDESKVKGQTNVKGKGATAAATGCAAHFNDQKECEKDKWSCYVIHNDRNSTNKCLKIRNGTTVLKRNSNVDRKITYHEIVVPHI